MSEPFIDYSRVRQPLRRRRPFFVQGEDTMESLPGVWVLYKNIMADDGDSEPDDLSLHNTMLAMSVHQDLVTAIRDQVPGEFICYWPFGMDLPRAVRQWDEESANYRENRGF